MEQVCIVGAGAVGGAIGARLALAGRVRVSALARGTTLHSLREHGWRLRTPEVESTCAARASDNAADLGVQDLVIVAVKGPALPAVAAQIGPLIGPRTVVLPAMNGVPWWFNAHLPGWRDAPIQAVDPGGSIGRAFPLAHVVGCVVHIAASVPEPGVVLHRSGRGLIVGEPAGGVSERVRRIAALLGDAGFEVTTSADVRADVWYKLWGNLTMNPVCAITGATLAQVLADPLVRDFCSRAMEEAAAIGARIGCPITQSAEDRHAVTAKLGAVKPSMLQDVEAGRPVEIDAIVAAVLEIAQRVGVAAPHIGAVLGLARLHARVRGLYPPAA